MPLGLASASALASDEQAARLARAAGEGRWVALVTGATLPYNTTVTLDVGPGTWFLQSTAYVACTPSIDIDTKVGGFKTFFGGEGLFVLKASGQGQVIVGAFGALEKVDIDGSLVIDTGHLVAWEDSPDLTFRVGKAGSGWIASFLSGEGLVCKFKGKGTVWIQTRNPAEYGTTVGRLLPPK